MYGMGNMDGLCMPKWQRFLNLTTVHKECLDSSDMLGR